MFALGAAKFCQKSLNLMFKSAIIIWGTIKSIVKFVESYLKF